MIPWPVRFLLRYVLPALFQRFFIWSTSFLLPLSEFFTKYNTSLWGLYRNWTLLQTFYLSIQVLTIMWLSCLFDEVVKHFFFASCSTKFCFSFLFIFFLLLLPVIFSSNLSHAHIAVVLDQCGCWCSCLHFLFHSLHFSGSEFFWTFKKTDYNLLLKFLIVVIYCFLDFMGWLFYTFLKFTQLPSITLNSLSGNT